LPGGNIEPNSTFMGLGMSGYWWTATAGSTNDTEANHLNMFNRIGAVRENWLINKDFGLSVRFLRDN
jgi:hypothetical protein